MRVSSGYVSTKAALVAAHVANTQFEREVTGERIRDKIAVSKRKGMWMGVCHR